MSGFLPQFCSLVTGPAVAASCQSARIVFAEGYATLRVHTTLVSGVVLGLLECLLGHFAVLVLTPLLLLVLPLAAAWC